MIAPSLTAPRPLPSEQRSYTPLVLLATLITVPAFFAIIPADEWSAASLYLVVLAIGALPLYHLGIKRVDPAFPATLFVLAFIIKILSGIARYWMVFDLYDGAADAPLYHEHGQILAQYFKVFDFSIIETYTVRGEGTTMLAHITGLLYTVMPVSMAGAFLFFAGLAFTGVVFCYRAARIAWPAANLGYYSLCVFFLPSILFWPAALGKDAWILCWSGVAVWGWASFTRRNNLLGLLWIGLALLLLQLVRPHIAAFLAIAMGAAYLLYSTRGQRSVLAWLVGGIVVVGLGIYMVQSGADFLELEELSTDALQARIEEQQQRTTQGGSRYETISIFTPTGLVMGLLTAAVRPFPWEANSLPILMTSLETMGWLLFCWLQRRAFLHNLRTLRGDPVRSFAFFYACIMLLALTSMGNFGIVARQRVMALPFLWMLFI